MSSHTQLNHGKECMNTREELVNFGKQWDLAMVSNDPEAISRFLADDWVIVGTEGGIMLRSAFLEWIGSGDLIHTEMDAEEMHVQIYENTGVVTSRGTSSGFYKGEAFSDYEWSTSVFIRKDGVWRCVLTILTPALP
jgi:ketosteroid isomerase-like protein